MKIRQIAFIATFLSSLIASSGTQFFDHRGWPNVFPEETMEAYRASVAAGAECIEVDVQAIKDGTLVCMHDGTVDRTTPKTGNVADFSGPAWSQLIIDSSNFLGAGWGDYPAPRFDDIVREFGNRKMLLIEIKDQKDSTSDAVLALLQRYSISKSLVLINSFQPSNLTVFIADGWQCSPNYGTYTGTPTPSDIVATGAQWVGVQINTSTTQMDALRLAGLKVVPYTAERLYEIDNLNGHVDAVYVNEGAYLRGTARSTTDPFSTQTWYHGQLKGNSNGGGGGRGAFYPPNMWGLSMTTNAFASTLQGWANPIGGGATCGAMKIAFTVKFESATATDRWASLAVTTTDQPFTSDASGSGLNGYHFLVYKNGLIGVYRLDNGTPTSLQIKNTGVTSIPDGGTANYLITITTTTVKLERLDVAYATNALSDSTYRGVMLHAGVKGTVSKFSNISITDIVP